MLQNMKQRYVVEFDATEIDFVDLFLFAISIALSETSVPKTSSK